MGLSPELRLEQNYQYGLYGKSQPFLGLTGAGRVTPQTQVEPTTGISMPGQIGYVSDESGNKISLGQDGVGLAHRNPDEYGFMAIT